jgi:glycosyltransferase involved in cell wall biosynthesis
MKRIALLNTAHFPFDDRVYYHQAKALLAHNYQVFIISSKQQYSDSVDGIYFECFDGENMSQTEKKNSIIAILRNIKPDLIICDSPLSVISAFFYKRNKKTTIFYDITEWYPSKKNLNNKRGLKLVFGFAGMVIMSLIAGIISNGFIFGEHYKSLPFKRLFPRKRNMILPYYPDKSYLTPQNHRTEMNEFRLLYSGLLNRDKGIFHFIEVLRQLKTTIPDQKFYVKIIGDFASEKDKAELYNATTDFPLNIRIELEKSMPFDKYCHAIPNFDLYFDLRNSDFENMHCLPIKLFYYMACGRPVIFSQLKSIEKEFPDFNFGFLTDPTDAAGIADKIAKYVYSPELYFSHSNNALFLYQNKYNWNHFEPQFISFINNELRP